ncbi:hypothetical protein MASR2M78_03020 [Treponema sp.]
MTSSNEKILKARFPYLYERIKNLESISSEYQILPSLSGQPTVKIQELFIHSSRDPQKEGEKLAALSGGEGPLVILGFGLGYLADAALALDASRELIIVESRLELLALAFQERDLREILSHEKIAFVVGSSPESLIAVLETFGGKPTLASNRALRELDKTWYDAAEAALLSWQSRDEINAATLRRFGKRWVRNLSVNMQAIRDLPGIGELSSVAQGFPALIIAAGPSLDEILPFIKEIQERCILIVVDTALRAVLSMGVEPDFVVVVDPQFWNARHLDRCPAPSSCLISESAVYPSVLRASFKRTFLCASLFPLGRFIEDCLNPKGVLGAGGSVATTAWDFARVLGADPLWIAGLDLSFPELKTHFKGALFEERALSEAGRLKTLESRSFRALRDGQPFLAPSNAGTRVLTDKRLSLYASWFENRFVRYPSSCPKNLSTSGLKIAGMRVHSVQEILSLVPRRTEIHSHLEEVFHTIENAFFNQTTIQERKDSFKKAFQALKEGLIALQARADEAASSAEQAVQALGSRGELGARSEIEAALRVLDEAERAIQGSPVKEVAGFLFPPLSELEKGIEEPKNKTQSYLELSSRLFRSLEEACRYHQKVLGSYTFK